MPGHWKFCEEGGIKREHLKGEHKVLFQKGELGFHHFSKHEKNLVLFLNVWKPDEAQSTSF